MNAGWMLFDTISGNAIDMTHDPEVAVKWSQTVACETNLAIFSYWEEDMSDEEFKPKEGEEDVEMEPGDDTEEAQPSIEREGAPIGSTGGGSSAAGESGGIGQAGNPG